MYEAWDMIILGIDPDSNKSGVAVYSSGVLIKLECMTLMKFHNFLNENTRIFAEPPELHIENVNGNRCSSFNWIKKGKPKPILDKINGKISEGVGKCKQAQVEIERVAEYFGFKIVHHNVSSKWKDAHDGKRQFEMVTKWKKQSNPDSRSAAYFGFLGCKI